MGNVIYYVVAQILGAMFGQLVVVATHRPYYLQTENPNNILGTFSTISSLDKGTPESRKAATINGFINEFAGSFVLFFAALGLTKNFFGAEVAGSKLKKLRLNKEESLMRLQQQQNWLWQKQMLQV